MPIVQISKIQIRRGALNELPTALAEGELGMSLDTGEVFIGAPNFPPIANRTTFPKQNIQLLTEFSIASLSSTSLNYVYKYQDPDDTLFPGSSSNRATSSFTVERLLQERLDEIVSVKSYGATGNGTTDDTLAIQNAIADLYDPIIGRYRLLYFPAGIYIVSSPLSLYPRSNWLGDGIGKSIIRLAPDFDFQGSLDPDVDDLPNNPDILDSYTIVNGSGTFGGELTFSVSPGDQIYYTGVMGQAWRLVTDAFSAVAQTANSDGNTGSNINDFTDDVLVTNALPEDIQVRNLSFERNTTGDVIRLDRASRCLFENVCFSAGFDTRSIEASALTHGDFTTSTNYNSNRHGICVRIDSLSNLVSEVLGSTDFIFQNCEFRTNTYAFYVTDDISNVTVTGSIFEQLFKAVSLGEGCIPEFQDNTGELSVPSPFDGDEIYGPSNFRVTHSRFNRIMDSCFSVFSTNGGNLTGYNLYENYGQGDAITSITPTSPAVLFYADYDAEQYTNKNMSIGDIFDQTGDTLPADTALRVRNISSRNVVINPQDHQHLTKGLELGSTFTHLPMEPINNLLEAGQVNFPTGIILETDAPQRANSIVVEYTISRGEGKRKGELNIVSDGLDLEWTETYSDFGDPMLITFEVTNTESRKVRVKFTDISTGADANFGVDAYLRWQAHYWDHSFVSEGAVVAVDDELDITGTSGSEDWGLITSVAIEFEDYGSIADPTTETDNWGFVT